MKGSKNERTARTEQAATLRSSNSKKRGSMYQTEKIINCNYEKDRTERIYIKPNIVFPLPFCRPHYSLVNLLRLPKKQTGLTAYQVPKRYMPINTMCIFSLLHERLCQHMFLLYSSTTRNYGSLQQKRQGRYKNGTYL